MAQAAPVGGKADAKCLAEANKTLGPGFKPSDYTFIGGTEGPDPLGTLTDIAGPDVICGFGGRDTTGTLEAGDIFLGGDGDDFLRGNDGTFYGGEGDDEVTFNSLSGTFNGGEGNDSVGANNGILINVP